MFTTSSDSLYQLLNPNFGNRLLNGFCPPMKYRGTVPPGLDFCPFIPLPQVLPLPDPNPRPTLNLYILEPGLSHKLFALIGKNSEFLVKFLRSMVLDGI